MSDHRTYKTLLNQNVTACKNANDISINKKTIAPYFLHSIYTFFSTFSQLFHISPSTIAILKILCTQIRQRVCRKDENLQFSTQNSGAKYYFTTPCLRKKIPFIKRRSYSYTANSDPRTVASAKKNHFLVLQ